jgi:hypothetical protein
MKPLLWPEEMFIDDVNGKLPAKESGTAPQQSAWPY